MKLLLNSRKLKLEAVYIIMTSLKAQAITFSDIHKHLRNTQPQTYAPQSTECVNRITNSRVSWDECQRFELLIWQIKLMSLFIYFFSFNQRAAAQNSLVNENNTSTFTVI